MRAVPITNTEFEIILLKKCTEYKCTEYRLHEDINMQFPVIGSSTHCELHNSGEKSSLNHQYTEYWRRSPLYGAIRRCGIVWAIFCHTKQYPLQIPSTKLEIILLENAKIWKCMGNFLPYASGRPTDAHR